MERVAVFAALPWEGRTVLKSVQGVERVFSTACPAWSGHAPGREVWLVRTGMGEECAAAAAEAVANTARFQLFLSTGCAAGLVPELAPGDVVIADAIVASGHRQRFGTDIKSRELLEHVARDAGVRSATGAFACCGAVLAGREAKQAEAEASRAIAAEMEGAAIARSALRAGVPFAAVRAILDPLDVELRHAMGLVDPASGRVRPLEVVRRLARSTAAWSELIAMQRMMAAARSGLERLFAALLGAAADGASEESSDEGG